METTPQLDGADQVVDWWGEWISFHDFYLLHAPAQGSVDGELRIHGWVTDWENIDPAGCFAKGKDCVVTFKLGGIRSIELSSREFPAIIFAVRVHRITSGWSVSWTSSYGAEGAIEAAAVRIDLKPGSPEPREEAG